MDKKTFSSLVGMTTISDAELETVTGGLEGGHQIMATTTTTAGTCSCTKTPVATGRPGTSPQLPDSCACSC